MSKLPYLCPKICTYIHHPPWAVLTGFQDPILTNMNDIPPSKSSQISIKIYLRKGRKASLKNTPKTKQIVSTLSTKNILGCVHAKILPKKTQTITETQKMIRNEQYFTLPPLEPSKMFQLIVICRSRVLPAPYLKKQTNSPSPPKKIEDPT